MNFLIDVLPVAFIFTLSQIPILQDLFTGSCGIGCCHFYCLRKFVWQCFRTWV